MTCSESIKNTTIAREPFAWCVDQLDRKSVTLFSITSPLYENKHGVIECDAEYDINAEDNSAIATKDIVKSYANAIIPAAFLALTLVFTFLAPRYIPKLSTHKTIIQVAGFTASGFIGYVTALNIFQATLLTGRRIHQAIENREESATNQTEKQAEASDDDGSLLDRIKGMFSCCSEEENI